MDVLSRWIKSEELGITVSIGGVSDGTARAKLIFEGGSLILPDPLTVENVYLLEFIRAIWNSLAGLLIFQSDAFFYIEDSALCFELKCLTDDELSVEITQGLDVHFKRKFPAVPAARAFGGLIRDALSELERVDSRFEKTKILDSLVGARPFPVIG